MLYSTLVIASLCVSSTFGQLAPASDNCTGIRCQPSACESISCPGHRVTMCKTDECGCNAQFFVNDIQVDCAGPCPNCISGTWGNPCHYTRCPAYPEATCEIINCENCLTKFYVKDSEVNCFYCFENNTNKINSS